MYFIFFNNANFLSEPSSVYIPNFKTKKASKTNKENQNAAMKKKI